MSRRILIGFGISVAVASMALPAVAGDLPRSGSFSAHYGWTFTGQVQELAPEHTVSAGVVPGVMFNDAGKGFMHKARTDCTILNDVREGRSNARGTCVVTDASGDRIFIEWKCAGVMPACPGDQRFLGGTGKYEGISGSMKFQGNFIGATGAGWSDWSGEYKLP